MSEPDRLARALVDAAMELHRRRLWLEVPPDVPILVRLPGEPHSFVVTVMGHLNSDYGIMVMRGDDALNEFLSFVESPAGSMAGLDILAMTVEPLGSIPPDLRRVLDAAKLQARREALVPALYAKPKRIDVSRAINRSEQRVLLGVIRALLSAHSAQVLRVDDPSRANARLFEITLEDAGAHPTISTRTVPWPRRAPIPGHIALEIAPDVPKLDERWALGVLFDENDFPAEHEPTQLVALADEESGRVLEQRLRSPDSFAEVTVMLSIVIHGQRPDKPAGLPREIAFNDRALFDHFGPTLRARGVLTSFDELNETLDNLTETCLDALEEIVGEVEREECVAPAPTTLDEWKAADLRVTRKLSTWLERDAPVTGRSLARYFGSEVIGARVLHELPNYQPIASFIEWRMTNYRATVRSKTYFETLLRTGRLTDLERTFVESRIAARTSIYRVVDTQPGESLDLEDIFDGTQVRVQDRALSACAMRDHCLCLRVMKVAHWNFLALAGPPLPPMIVQHALNRLEYAGVELSSQELSKRPEVLGRLWGMVLPDNRPEIRIGNTDGDPLVWHKASFRVADPAAVAKAIGAKTDIEFDEPAGEWVWFRAGGPVAGFGETTTLGRIQILDRTLLLEVNSEARFVRARKWIETLPGVEFERVSTSAIGDHSGALDDKLPEKSTPPDPELFELTKSSLAKLNKRWLDERIPALNHLTPREACKTTAGRRRVEAMIRSMPATSTPFGPIEPAREELLRELMGPR